MHSIACKPVLWFPGEWWDPCDRDRWATSKRMLRAPHPEEGEQPDADQGKTTFSTTWTLIALLCKACCSRVIEILTQGQHAALVSDYLSV